MTRDEAFYEAISVFRRSLSDVHAVEIIHAPMPEGQGYYVIRQRMLGSTCGPVLVKRLYYTQGTQR